MNLATIVRIESDGRPPYQSANGPLYGQKIQFDDNREGLANSKTEVPPYRVGEVVGYDVVGKVGPFDKLKITRNPQQVQQTAQPRQVQTGTRANYAPTTVTIPPGPPVQTFHTAAEPITPVFGATVGMAINQALELLTKGMDYSEIKTRVVEPTWWAAVHEVASDVIRVSRHLEAGHLAPSPTERQNRLNGQKNAPVPPSRHEPKEDDIPF